MAIMRTTLMVRRIKKLHQQWTDFLLGAKDRSLRRAALELDNYWQENKSHMDAAFLAEMLKMIEFAIRDVAQQSGHKSKWTAERAKYDLRGKTTLHKKRDPIRQRPLRREHTP